MIRRFLLFLAIVGLLFSCIGARYKYYDKPVYKTGRPTPAVYTTLKEKNPILPFDQVDAADWWWVEDHYNLYVATPKGLYYSPDSGITWEVENISSYKFRCYNLNSKLVESVMHIYISYPPFDVTLISPSTIYLKLRKPNGKTLYLVKDPQETGGDWKEPVSYNFSFFKRFGNFPNYKMTEEGREAIAQILNKEKGVDLESAKDSIFLWTRSLSDQQSSFAFTPDYIVRVALSGSQVVSQVVPFPDYVRREEIYWVNNGYMPKELWMWTKRGLFISLDGGATCAIHLRNSVTAKEEIASFRKQVEKVSDEKVKKMVAGLGLSEDESNNLARRIKNLERSKIDYILRMVLELPLYGSASYREYCEMSLYQKLYVVLTAAEKEGSKIRCLKEWLHISGKTASNLANIDTETLLRK